jgi:predicted amidohydrolase
MVAPELNEQEIVRASESIANLFALLWGYLSDWCREKDIGGSLYPGINDTFVGTERHNWKGRKCIEYNSIFGEIRAAKSERLPKVVLRYLLGSPPAGQSSEAIGVCETPRIERPFVVALAIDEAFLEVHPMSNLGYEALPQRLRAPFNRYGKDGYYNSEIKRGFVIATSTGTAHRRSNVNDVRLMPRNSIGNANIEEHFTYLTFVSRADKNYFVRACRLDGEKDPEIPPHPRIAVVPLAESKDDIRVESLRGNEGRYCVHIKDVPKNRRLERLAKRAERAILELDEAGFDIAIFPELVVSPEISDAILTALQRAAGNPDRPAQHLKLVIAGSGHVSTGDDRAPYNECRVYHGEGGEEPLWVQRKLNHFWMNGETLASLVGTDQTEIGVEEAGGEGVGVAKVSAMVALSGELIDKERSYSEHMTAGDTVIVADSPSARMVVAICEDFAQPYLVSELGAQLRPDWVFVPVMDTELGPRRWTRDQAGIWAKLGCRTVVANSAVLPQVQRDREKTFPPEVVVGHVVGPVRKEEGYFTVPTPGPRIPGLGPGPLPLIGSMLRTRDEVDEMGKADR